MSGTIVLFINPQTLRVTFAYDAADRRTVKRLRSGSRTTYVYDAADRITRLANLKSTGATISRFDYRYDNVGNRTSVIDAHPSATDRACRRTAPVIVPGRAVANPTQPTHSSLMPGPVSKRDLFPEIRPRMGNTS